VKAGRRILAKTSELLNIKVKDTTLDGRFSLKVVRCLGCCGISPTIMVDNATFGRVKPTDLPNILAKFE
jgi:NADH:ubiquinone oxidoreductase subunit E